MCPYIIVLWSYKKLLGSGQPFLQTRAITVFNWCPNWWTLVAHLTKSSMRGSVNSQKRLYYFSDPSRAIFFLFYILKTKKRIFSDAAATGVNWWTTGGHATSWINPLQLCFFHIWTQRKIFCDKTMTKRAFIHHKLIARTRPNLSEIQHFSIDLFWTETVVENRLWGGGGVVRSIFFSKSR